MVRFLLLIVLCACCLYMLTGCGRPNFAGRWEVTKVTNPDGSLRPLGTKPPVVTFTPTAYGYDATESDDSIVTKVKWAGSKLVCEVDIAGTRKKTFITMSAGKMIIKSHDGTITEARRL